MEFEPQRPEICNAIKNKQCIEFVYHKKHRKGNPQCYGITKKGKEALRVHLIEGGTQPEQMFLLNDTDSFNILEERFTGPGPNYSKGDRDMLQIFCQLDGSDGSENKVQRNQKIM